MDEEPKAPEVEAGLKSMIDKYGMDKIADALARMAQKDQQ
mgnify:FL=1